MRLLDAGDLADDERHALVEQRLLRPGEVLGPLAAHRDVHEPGLVDVVAGRVDDHDLDLAGVDAALELAREQVGGEGPPDTAAEDEDPLHGDRYRIFSTMISS